MKKLTKAAVASVLAANLAFGLAACADTGNGTTPGDNNSGGNNPGGGETQAAALLDEALVTLAEQDYITFELDVSGRQIGGTDDALHTAEMLVQLAQDEEYGYDVFARQSSDGKVISESLFVDGTQYATQMIDGKLWYYVSGSMGGSLGPNPDPVPDTPAEVTNSGSTASGSATHSWISLILSSGNLFQTYGALLSLAGLDSLAGIEGAVTQTSGGTQISLTVQLDEVRQSLIEWLNALKPQSLDGLEAIVNELFDEDITVVEFLDKLDSILSPNGLALAELLTDKFIATVLIAGLSNGMPPADILETIHGNTAQYLYEVLMENAGEQVGNILSEPKAGESVYTYVRRIFGQFKVTGIIDMLTGETGSGAEGFADLKEQFAALVQENYSIYDLINLVLNRAYQTGLDEIFGSLKQGEYGESNAELTVNIDEEGRIAQSSFVIDYEQYDADESDDYYVERMDYQIEGTLNVSYDAFTLTPPSEDQLLPAFGTPQIDEEAGSIFIPVEWNCTEPGEAYADVDLSFEAWSEEGYYLGSDSLDARNLSIEQTQEGIFLDVDLTGSWEGLRQTIDQLLTGGYGDIPFRYEVRMWITVTLHHEYQNFEGLYSAEGDEIINAHISFEGPWIIW